MRSRSLHPRPHHRLVLANTRTAGEEKEMNAYVMNELARGRQADLMAQADRGRLAWIAREAKRGQHDARLPRAGKLLAAAATAAPHLTAPSAIVPHCSSVKAST